MLVGQDRFLLPMLSAQRAHSLVVCALLVLCVRLCVPSHALPFCREFLSHASVSRRVFGDKCVASGLHSIANVGSACRAVPRTFGLGRATSADGVIPGLSQSGRQLAARLLELIGERLLGGVVLSLQRVPLV